MREEIIALLPSKSLKRKIRECGYSFSEMDLLRIIFDYAPTFDARIQYLERFAEGASSEVAAIAKRCVVWQKEILRDFMTLKAGEIYQLYIKHKPGASEEDYLCDSFEAAMKAIDRYYAETARFGDIETPEARYTLIKRAIYSPHTEGELLDEQKAICILGAGKIVWSVEDFARPCSEADCNGKCADCDQPCLFEDILFPAFLQHKDLVRYTELEGNTRFGICHGFGTDTLWDSVYVIPLDCEAIRYRDYEKVHYFHDHIASPRVEAASMEELDEKMRGDYLAYADYLNQEEN